LTLSISLYALFDWYQVVYYLTPTVEYPFEKKLLGRWIGVSEACIDEMAFVVLLSTNCKPIIRKTVWGLGTSDDSLLNPTIKSQIVVMDYAIRKIADSSSVELLLPLPDNDIFHTSDDEVTVPFAGDLASLELHHATPEEIVEYLSSKLLLPIGGEFVKARVTKRKTDLHGIPLGMRNPDPILDTREYIVEFPDGSLNLFNTNMIIENLISQIDSQGKVHLLFQHISDHRQTHHNVSSLSPHSPLLGWELPVDWANGTTSWLPLMDVKQSNPIELAEYAVANQLADKPTFSWWVCNTLRKRDHFIKKVKTHYWKRIHKYGVELPISVSQALAIDV
jgi:hypothetical protein